MRRACVSMVLLGSVLVTCAVAVGSEATLPDELAGFRSWKRLTKEPQIVPYQLSILCAVLPPTLENLRRHGPHTNHSIMVYANPLASAALQDRSVPHFPPGAIIAKEKLAGAAAAPPDGVAFMVKRPVGEFAASGGWEFSYYPSGGAKVSYDTCISCHRAGAVKDYVFGRYGHPDPK